jgi:hypothetical protein
MSEPAWKEFEDLVERLQRVFNPRAKIIRNDHIRGRNSGSLRQIDISIRQQLGIHELLIIVDCKKRGRKADVNDVGVFAELKDDVGAHLAVLVNELGFSGHAKNLAKRREISLLMLRDTHVQGWQHRIQMPLLVEYWKIVPMLIQVTRPDGTQVDIEDERDIELTDIHSGGPLHVADCLLKCWSEEGKKREGSIGYEFDGGDIAGGGRMKLLLGFNTTRELYINKVPFGFLGLVDQEKGIFHTEALTSCAINIDEVRKNWPRIQDTSKLPMCLCVRAYEAVPEKVINPESKRQTKTVRFSFKSTGAPISLPANTSLELNLSLKK